MDADIQVWLEAAQRTQPQIIVPYIKSPVETTLKYVVEARRSAAQGSSRLRQGGTIHLTADQATALGTLALTRSAQDTCEVTMTLRTADNTERKFQLPCPGFVPET
ncbi:curli-like amyloid fiber formation chaperone CsgH [Pusillimonas minor]|uniref:Curli assembly protein CsgC n=1 Tax=Pusillimonas minor TaxID=2697024 RepID=A0A842HL91_9BURK|nr:curli-like amyloid fiber formation chaperone CsgH [Pusillimonas minor]MBC2769539.1 hypothetical protein [Pusillimonas minor]